MIPVLSDQDIGLNTWLSISNRHRPVNAMSCARTHRRSQEFILEGPLLLLLGWVGHSWTLMAAVSLPSRVLGRKTKEFWRNFFVKTYFLGMLGRGYVPSAPWLRPCRYVLHNIRSSAMFRTAIGLHGGGCSIVWRSDSPNGNGVVGSLGSEVGVKTSVVIF